MMCAYLYTYLYTFMCMIVHSRFTDIQCIRCIRCIRAFVTYVKLSQRFCIIELVNVHDSIRTNDIRNDMLNIFINKQIMYDKYACTRS